MTAAEELHMQKKMRGRKGVSTHVEPRYLDCRFLLGCWWTRTRPSELFQLGLHSSRTCLLDYAADCTDVEAEVDTGR